MFYLNKMNNIKLPLSQVERNFDLNNFGISTPPDYKDFDIFDFKQGSYHSKNKKKYNINHNV